MKTKKITSHSLLGFKNRFLIGLTLSLSFCLYAFEYTSIRVHEVPEDKPIAYLDDVLILPPVTYQIEKLEKPAPEEKKTPEFVVVEHTNPEKPNEEVKLDKPDEPFEFNPEDYGMMPEKIDDEPEPPVYFAEFFAHYDNCAGMESSELYSCSMQDIVNRIKKNFVIPEELKSESGELSATMSFMVNKKGEISKIEVIQTNHPKMGEASARAISRLPVMNPARHKDKAVDLILRVPINLIIEN